jgi:hypothetical protein
MKKKIVFLAALCFTMGAYANILRVNNVDSSAPYASIAAAVAAAADGDTIMVDGTSVDYDDVTKRLVAGIVGQILFCLEIKTESVSHFNIKSII